MNDIPTTDQPPSFQRDPMTGLVVGQSYPLRPDGRIDWRALVDRKFLYVARENEDKVVKEQGKPLNECDLALVRDDWLRIRIGGLNQLAHLRGVRACRYPKLEVTEGKASTVCEIDFIGNRETGMEPETWSAIASACRSSMDVKMLPYLETFAENRAFGRCVKRALQINILSDIEVGGDGRKAVEGGDTKDSENTVAPEAASEAPTGFQPHQFLATKCRDNKDAKGKAQPITFAALRDAAIKMNAEVTPERANEKCVSDPGAWVGFESIPPADVWLLMGKIEAAGKPAKPKAG